MVFLKFEDSLKVPYFHLYIKIKCTTSIIKKEKVPLKYAQIKIKWLIGISCG